MEEKAGKKLPEEETRLCPSARKKPTRMSVAAESRKTRHGALYPNLKTDSVVKRPAKETMV
jgi:hypothetical protein